MDYAARNSCGGWGGKLGVACEEALSLILAGRGLLATVRAARP